MLAVMMGGQTAEEMVFGDITTGASSDLQNANRIARKMVTEYGMSALGPRTFEMGQDLTFLGKELSQGQSYSDAVKEKVDAEIGHLLDRAKQTAKRIIESQRDRMTQLANRLLSEETLEGTELQAVLCGPSEGGPEAA